MMVLMLMRSGGGDEWASRGWPTSEAARASSSGH